MSKQPTQETPEQVPPEQPEAAEPVEQPQAPPDGESATADEILQTEYEEAKKLVRQLTPEERERLRQLSQDYIKELSSPIIAGEWDVTYVRCRYVQYYLITPVEFQVAVLENPDEVDIRLYGSKVTVSLNDIVGPRVGWLPHLLHPEGLPVFLLTSSPWMNHRAITAEEVVKKFTREDLEKIGDAVEAYQTRKVGALLVDYARDLKAWKETANRRGLSHYEQSLSILQQASIFCRHGNYSGRRVQKSLVGFIDGFPVIINNNNCTNKLFFANHWDLMNCI